MQAVSAERGETYEGREDVVLTQSEGAAEWLVTVEEAGLYAIAMDYYLSLIHIYLDHTGKRQRRLYLYYNPV